jgi:hypothetical protein
LAGGWDGAVENRLRSKLVELRLTTDNVFHILLNPVEFLS